MHKIESLINENIDKFNTYMRFLQEKNKVMNLTNIVEDREIFEKHFFDSLYLLEVEEIKSNTKLIDIGTGAGFPGVPLAIVREDLEFTLIDARNKRVEFLKELINLLGLKNVEVFHVRSEELAHNRNFREKYDYALSRAVTNLRDLMEYSAPFLKIGGKVISYKSIKSSQELEESKSAIKTLNLELEKLINYKLFDYDRSLVIIKKNKKTDSIYPRSNAQMKKKPL